MRAFVRKLTRYATVSVISTGVSMCVLGGLVATATLAAGWAFDVTTESGEGRPDGDLDRDRVLEAA